MENKLGFARGARGRRKGKIDEKDLEVQTTSYKFKSHRDVIYSTENIANNSVITFHGL